MSPITDISITSVRSFRFSQNGNVSTFSFIGSFDKQLFPPVKTDASRIKLPCQGRRAILSKRISSKIFQSALLLMLNNNNNWHSR